MESVRMPSSSASSFLCPSSKLSTLQNTKIPTRFTPCKSGKEQSLIRETLTNPASKIFQKSQKFTPLETKPSQKFDSSELPVVPADSLKYESGFLGAVPSRDGVPLAGEYLPRILAAKVYDVAVESPLDYAPKLSDKLGVHVWLKREDLQPIFSFKLRGAYNMMSKLPRDVLERGVICASAGNHAQGVALAAQKLGCKAVISMPLNVPEIKRMTVEKLGGTVVLVGEHYDESVAYAKKRAKEEGMTFVPGFDHPDIIAGQGTVGMELVRQMPDSVHAVFVPVGGGGLIAGVAAFVKGVRPEVKVIGVQPYDANSMALSLHHGRRVMLERVGAFAEGVSMGEVGEETFRICQELLDGVVLVDHSAICAAIKDMFEEKRSILEAAGALSIAGAEAYCKYYGLKGENVVAVTSGANINFDKLRLVSQLGDLVKQSEAVLATFVPSDCRSLKEFFELIGQLDINELLYRNNDKKESTILYRVSFQKASQLEQMLNQMMSTKLQTINLTNNNLVNGHFQCLMDGREKAESEIRCQFIFKEKSGALRRLLDIFGCQWNVSFIHLHEQGVTGVDILAGFQVPSSEIDEFKRLAASLGCDYTLEADNDALQLLFHQAGSQATFQ